MLPVVEHNAAPQSRLLARVIRDVLATEAFESLADLVEAVKVRCKQLHLRWSNDDIGGALRLVGSNHPLVTPRPAVVVDVPVSRDLTRREAAEVWTSVVDHFGPRAFKALSRRGVSPVVIDDTRTDDVVDIASMVGGGR